MKFSRAIAFLCQWAILNAALSQSFSDPNFTAIPIGSGWNQAVGAAFSPDGQRLFVWERAGRLYVCNRDGSGNYIKQSTPVADISEEVADWDAHGFLGFAADPDFEANGLIYLLYAVDRHHLLFYGTPSYSPNTTITGQATIGRVTRYQTTTASGNLVINPSSRFVLIGETKSTGMPILHHSHGIGTLAFASDRTLLVTIGDGASYEGIDGGSFPGTFYQQALTDGIIRSQENVGAFRAQMLNSMSGKLLRIDPATGNGLPSNPFYQGSDPRSPRSRVWAFGLRNPFRIFIKPGSGSTDPALGDIGEVFIGDVGFASWEEMNICKAGGTNFGWPIYEGNEYTIPLDGVGGITYKDLNVANQDEPNPLYGSGGCTQQFLYFRQLIKQATVDDNKTIYNPCNTSVILGTGNRYYHRRPDLEWSHAHPWTRVGIFNGSTPSVAMIGSPESQVVGTPFPGQCSVGGTYYTGNNFPAIYKNTYFQADFGNYWIKRITLDNANVITRVDNFASNYTEIVCITQNPLDGTLVTVQLGSATGVKKVQYGGNQPPVAVVSASANFGASPLSVNFTGSNSYDPTPGGSIVSYSWNFGGGSPATSNVANPGNIVFTENTGSPKKFVVKLTVTDNGGATHTDSTIVSVNNTPPVVNISSPVKNSFYNPGPDTLYSCTATVSDAQHESGQLTYAWQTILRHNSHEHREAINNAVSPSTLIQRVGFYGSDIYYWLIELTVTDAAGLSTKDSAKIFPNTSGGGDITPPVITSVSPVNGANGVSTGTTVFAYFNEAIDGSTVTSNTFQLRDPGNNLIAASRSSNGNQISLQPTAPLAGSTTYTATVTGGTGGVKDLSQNALANNQTWSFTTAAVDNTPPVVNAVAPVNGATGVSTSTTVSATFSEAISSSSVTSSTFQVKDPANNAVTGSLSTVSNAITFTPSNPLANSTTYTATITGGSSGVKDLAGNPLAANYNWSFTTAAASSQNPVVIQSFDTKTGSSATVHNLTAVPAGALLVLSTTSDAYLGDCIVTSVPSLVWTKRVDAGANSSDNAEIWTAVFSAGGTISVTSNWGSDFSQASVCFVVLNAEAVLGGASGTAVSQSAPSVTVTTTRDNSILFGCTADWKRMDGTSRTLREGALERLYFRDSHYTTYHYTKTAATISSYTMGVSNPTGQQASTSILEIRSNPGGSQNTAPSVMTQPVSQTKCAGQSVTFTSAATGTPAPTVQWQVSTNGSTWTNISNATGTSLTFSTTTADHNKQYRALWTNSAGTANSNAAVLTVNPIPVLSSGLTGSATSGTPYSYTPTSATPGTTFTWSRVFVPGISNAAANGTGIINETLVNTTTSPVNVTYVYNLNANGCSNSQNVVVTVSAGSTNQSPTVTTHPLSQAKCAGENATFSSSATGIPAPTVQWQVSTNGSTWTNISNETGSSLTFATSLGDHSKQYRALWTNSAGTANSNAAVLTVNAIPNAPTVSVVNNCGNSVLTAVSGSYTGALLWSTGATTQSITVASAATYTVTQTENGCTSPAGSGTAAPITSNLPAPSVSVVNNCSNSELTAVTGSYTGSLQWSTGATTQSITVTTADTYTVTQTENGCTSPAGSGIASPKPIPVMTSPLTASVTSGNTFSYSPVSSVSSTSFTWSRAFVQGISNAAANGTGSINETLVNTTNAPVIVKYEYTLLANGCDNTQNLLVTVNPVTVVNCEINSSITSSFNSTSIPAGRYIWFNSAFNPGSLGSGNAPVTLTVTNSVISFTANNVSYSLPVPNARIRFDATVSSASTQFVNNQWETVVPYSYSGYIFLSGLSWRVPVNLPGSIQNVNWTANISLDKTNISIARRWSAAVYTSFADHGGLNIKPIKANTQNPYANNNNAGTPENFKSSLVSGAKGNGGSNYTGNYSSTVTSTCAVPAGQRSPVQPVLITSVSRTRQLPELNAARAFQQDLEVEVLPNPTHSYFNVIIRGPLGSTPSIRITDLSGRQLEHQVKTGTGGVIQIGQAWKAGIYFIEVVQGSRRRYLKVVKVN